MQFLIFLLIWFLVNHSAFAQNIVIHTNQIMASPSGVITFTIDTADKFRIRPLINNGSIAIQNGTKWIDQNQPWDKMPFINSPIKIKVSDDSVKGSSIQFLIQDPLRGKVYTTTTIKTWPYEPYKRYLQKINQSIKEWRKNDKMSP